MSADPSPGDVEAAFAEHAARLAQLRFPDALAVGDRAPEFALPNAHGETVRLSELLARGPVALAFYRGAWCPYCNAHLRALQEALPEVRALGGSLAAISPQTPDHSLTMAERNELEFEVLSDPSSYVASDYGIVFTLGHADRELFLAVGNDVGAVSRLVRVHHHEY